MIVDTDVLIWYSRNNEKAKELLHSLRGFPISVITYMEIIQGVRNKQELNHFKKSLSILKIKVIQIDEMISTKAMFFVEQYALSHSMELADAMIGATSILQQIPLITGNDKHYKHLPGINIKKFLHD